MRARLLIACTVMPSAGVLLLAAQLRAQTDPPPPSAASARLPESVALPSSRAPEPEPEPDTIKLRLNGEYELRQTVLTPYRLAAHEPGGSAQLEQSSRLFHWLRLRPLLLVGTHWEVRGEADVPRGMIYGHELSAVPDSGSDFDHTQPLQAQLRMLRVTLRGAPGEVTLGHTTVDSGMGLLDNDGDRERAFGTPDRPATFERVELQSGRPDSTLRVGLAADLSYQNERVSLLDGDRLWRVTLSARYAPSERQAVRLSSRYETLRPRGDLGGSQLFVFDVAGSFRTRLPGRPGELFGEYEGAYRVGSVDEPTALASLGAERSVSALGGAARLGFALERAEAFRRYAHLVAWLEWGMASGDADPTDDDVTRFVMDPNHGVGLLLFGELMRFKTSRAQANLASSSPAAGNARNFGLATRGGVAGAAYVNPVLLLRPMPDLTLELGAVVASSTTNVVDPSRVAQDGERRNYDGGSPLARSLGSELDFGGELALPLDQPMLLRLSLQAAVAFPGSAFADADGLGLGTQALMTAGLGLTF